MERAGRPSTHAGGGGDNVLRKKPRSKPHPPPKCPSCGLVMTRRPTGILVRFECFNPKCDVLEVRIHNDRNRVIRAIKCQ